jgi:Skp family chaperone for outer membrane proteins
MNFADVTTTQWAIIGAIALVLVLVLVALLAQRKKRTEKLQTKFGEVEYTRAIQETGDRKQAEAVLEQRAERVEALRVRPLSATDRARFEDSWHRVQARFVDGPAGAVAEADQLLGDVMATRGYPLSSFEQRAADISVAHPSVLENYRTAHAIALRQSRGEATTEDLRQAMVHYRALFEQLINDRTATASAAV